MYHKVADSFKGSDPATWTSLPCQNLVFTDNTLDEMVSSSTADQVIKFMCVVENYTAFTPALTNEQIAAMTLPTQAPMTFTYDTLTVEIDRNYSLIFTGNTGLMHMGPAYNATYEFDGHLKILVKDSTFGNNT